MALYIKVCRFFSSFLPSGNVAELARGNRNSTLSSHNSAVRQEQKISPPLLVSYAHAPVHTYVRLGADKDFVASGSVCGPPRVYPVVCKTLYAAPFLFYFYCCGCEFDAYRPICEGIYRVRKGARGRALILLDHRC